MTYTPTRVQRRRVKGWKAPTCGCGCGKPARYVGRGTVWGNPFRVIKQRDAVDAVTVYFVDGPNGVTLGSFGPEPGSFDSPEVCAREMAVHEYRKLINETGYLIEDDDWAELAGHDLMCWCPTGTPCHADVLLEIANP